MRQRFQRREAFQPAAEDLLDMLHAFQVVLFNGAGQGCLLLAQEGMQEFFDQVNDAGRAAGSG